LIKKINNLITLKFGKYSNYSYISTVINRYNYMKESKISNVFTFGVKEPQC